MSVDIREMLYKKSAWVEEALRIARKLERSYDVVRGAILWQSYDFSKYSRAMSVRVPEVFPEAASQGGRATVQLVTGCRITDGEEKMDDRRLDEMLSDSVIVMEALAQSTYPNTQTGFVISSQYEGSVEWQDPGHGVQGYLSTFAVIY